MLINNISFIWPTFFRKYPILSPKRRYIQGTAHFRQQLSVGIMGSGWKENSKYIRIYLFEEHQSNEWLENYQILFLMEFRCSKTYSSARYFYYLTNKICTFGDSLNRMFTVRVCVSVHFRWSHSCIYLPIDSYFLSWRFRYWHRKQSGRLFSSNAPSHSSRFLIFTTQLLRGIAIGKIWKLEGNLSIETRPCTSWDWERYDIW